MRVIIIMISLVALCMLSATGATEKSGDIDHKQGSSRCCVIGGDVDNSGAVNVADVTFLIDYVFKGGPDPACLNSADPNANCSINVSDVVFLVDYIFKGGAPRCAAA